MVYDHALSPRLGQPTPVESTSVRMFSGADIPEAAWAGQIIYRTDTQTLQVFNGTGWEDVVGGVAGQLTYVGPDAPVGANTGDLWFDSDDGNKLYRWDGDSWEVVQDQAVVQAYAEAIVRAKTFTQDEPPTSESVGDVWFDSDDGNKMYRAATIGATMIGPGQWEDVADVSIASLQASSLLVQDNFELRGASNRIAGALELAAGVEAPDTMPTITSTATTPTSTFDLKNNAGTGSPTTFFTHNYYHDGTNWLGMLQSGNNTSVYSFDAVTGNQSASPIWSNSPAAGLASTTYGFSRVGSSFYLETGAANSRWYTIYKYSGAGFLLNSWTAYNPSNYGWSTADFQKLSAYCDGAFYYFTYSVAATGGTIHVTRQNLDGTGGVYLFSTAVFGTSVTNGCLGLWTGNADFDLISGTARRYVLQAQSGQVMVFSSIGNYQAAESWSNPDGQQSRSWYYDGTNLKTVGTNYRVYTLSKQKVLATKAVKYTRYDSTGTTHETDFSPPNAVTLGKRQYLRVQTPSPGGAGGSDEPNLIRHYIQNGGSGSFYRQPDVSSPWTVYYDQPVTGTATAPDGPDFSAIARPGILESTTQDSFGPLVQFKGDGTWRLASLVGMVVPWAGVAPVAPDGFLICDGSSYLRADYPDLAAILGHPVGGAESLALYYGAADATHFNVPNILGRVVAGYNPGDGDFDTIGELGGEKTHVLTAAEMPVHSHAANLRYTSNTTTGGGGVRVTDIMDVLGQTNSVAGWSPANAGGGGAHNNLQPYITMKYLIKV